MVDRGVVLGLVAGRPAQWGARKLPSVAPGQWLSFIAALLALARQRAMLLHLDVKEPKLEADIIRLLDAAERRAGALTSGSSGKGNR